MNSDDFCSFFQCYSILAEKQQAKEINYSSLSLSASLDTLDTFQGGIIVEWKKFRQEISVFYAAQAMTNLTEFRQFDVCLMAAWRLPDVILPTVYWLPENTPRQKSPNHDYVIYRWSLAIFTIGQPPFKKSLSWTLCQWQDSNYGLMSFLPADIICLSDCRQLAIIWKKLHHLQFRQLAIFAKIEHKGSLR